MEIEPVTQGDQLVAPPVQSISTQPASDSSSAKVVSHTRMFALLFLFFIALGVNLWYFYLNIDNKIVSVGSNAAPSTEEVIDLGSGYTKDNNYVYYHNIIVPNADPSTFVVLNDNYAKDKNNVYGYGVDEYFLSQVDLPTLTADGGVLKDAKTAYVYNNYQLVNATSSDPATFKDIGTCAYVEKSGASYYKDKDRVFIGPVVQNTIDAPSFVYLGLADSHGGMPYGMAYAKDINNVYVGCGEILSGADPVTFQYLGEGYAKDKSYIWSFDYMVDDADLQTFQILTKGYAKDKKQIYCGSPLKNADLATFEVVTDSNGWNVYGKDKSRVWSWCELIPNAVPSDCTPETLDKCLPASHPRG